MKKLTIYLILGIFLIGIVTSGLGVLNKDKVVEYEKNITDALETKGIQEWNIEDFENDDYMERCLISPTKYNLPCSGKMKTYWMNCTLFDENENECLSEVRIDWTEKEKEKKLDSWEKRRMEEIGKAIKSREVNIELNKTGEGKTTPTLDKKG